LDNKRKNLLKHKISKYIDQNKNWLIDEIIEITSANTINTPPVGNENNGQEIIMGILKDMGLEIDRFSPDSVKGLKRSKAYLEGRDYTNRDNIVGIIGKGKKKTLIFNGHIDTVPSDIFNWTKTEPFSPRVIDGKIYGLGVCDMKGGIISSIYALKAIIDSGISIKGKVIIESVVDEEFGGANGSLACVERGYRGDFAIIPEPTSMRVCVSNVGSKVFEVTIQGDTGLKYFGDNIEGINPILLTSKLILALKDYEDYLNSKKGDYKIYMDISKPMNFLFSDIIAGEIGPDKILTTPLECNLRIYLMNYPEVGEKQFTDMLFDFLKRYPEIHKSIESGGIVFSNSNRFIEGGDFDLGIDKNKEFIYKIFSYGKELTCRDLKLSAALGGTDFFTFSNYGNTPVVVFGPGGGNLHAADEYVELRDLVDLTKIYANIIYDYCCQ
jgi:acetylornithine deacetylase